MSYSYPEPRLLSTFLKKNLPYLLKLLSALSFDVALGATGSTYYAFSVCYHHEINRAHLLTLFFSIIFFYSVDHLYDLHRTKNTERSERRNFHASLRTVFIILAILSFLVIIPLVFFLNQHVIYTGFLLAGGVGIYFLIINSFNTNRYKDFLVAVGYSLGIWIPVFSYQFPQLDYSFLLPSFLFFLNTLITMILYAYFDIKSDKSEGIESFFSSFSTIDSKKILQVSALLNLGIIFLIFYSTTLPFILPLLLHAAILTFFTFFKKLNPTSVRWIGEYSYLIYFFWALVRNW